ncbi:MULTISPECIES: DUF6643 family protein [Streptomyces]|uniref:DUF6643 family protein n=1 Tax=Streptomyces TaxID=1883 RepID=UPI00163B7D0A|nr:MULTISPECIES: DUF6643 family protein [Streptomyces]MBC2874241.1 hypothetical protein [Streptomyces sp. TYQ1024]UBI40278.1 hypothetical protein K7I03_30060 [Streptomyces mobaraensis]UKW32857.1 hypothetical protein MCU78_29985 [Streptomyces sp. TYQ1024]
MTSPRSAYGSGYYSASSFPDTPIYDSLVAERGTPQIAPIRVSAPFDGGSNLPALPSGPSGHGPGPAPAAHPVQSLQSGYAQQPPQYGQGGPQSAGLQQAPAPYIPQQASAPRGYPGPQQYQQPQAGPAGPAGYDAMRPVAPRPAPGPSGQPGQPGGYEGPYQRPYSGPGSY